MSDTYAGLFTGVVTDNDDPEHKCRVKVEVPELLDGASGWCVPALPYAGDGAGFALVPPVGTSVLVQWPRGDLSAPPVWSGANYNAGAAVNGAGPNTVIVLTPGGHRLELSDDGKALTITCSEGPVITLDSNGIKIDNGGGATIAMQGSKVDVNNGALVVTDVGAFVLTGATQATCPHGGQATFVPSQSAVLADSSPVLLASDTTVVVGCPFVVGTVASPCVTVQWSAPATRMTVQQQPVLLMTSIGLCMNPASAPQGALIISSVQSRVQAT